MTTTNYNFERKCTVCGHHYDAAGLDMMYLDYCPLCESPAVKPGVKTFGLVKGRHDGIPTNDFIFDEVENPLALTKLEAVAASKIGVASKVDLYATGLTTALCAVIKYCVSNNIKLTVHHYNRESGEYVPQKIF